MSADRPSYRLNTMSPDWGNLARLPPTAGPPVPTTSSFSPDPATTSAQAFVALLGLSSLTMASPVLHPAR
jgi:hypothetical protein